MILLYLYNVSLLFFASLTKGVSAPLGISCGHGCGDTAGIAQIPGTFQENHK